MEVKFVIVRFDDKALSIFRKFVEKEVPRKFKNNFGKLKWKFLERELTDEEKEKFITEFTKELVHTGELCGLQFSPPDKESFKENFWEWKYPIIRMEIKRRGKNFKAKEGLMGFFPVICYREGREMADLITLTTFENLDDGEVKIIDAFIDRISPTVTYALLYFLHYSILNI